MIGYLRTIYQLTISPENILCLTANWRTKFTIVFLLIAWPSMSFLKQKRLQVKLDFIFNHRKFYFIADAVLDLINFREIFARKVYQIKLATKNPVIFDLGAGNGDSTIFFKLLYPTSRIFAFEPLPDNWKKLLLNVEQFTMVKTFPWVIGGQNKPVKFYVHPNSSLSSSLTRRVVNQQVIMRKMVTLDDIFKEEKLKKIDLIKFDVEGAEGKIFANLSKIKSVGALIGEVHLDLMGTSLEDFLGLFPEYKKKVLFLNNSRRLVILQK